MKQKTKPDNNGYTTTETTYTAEETKFREVIGLCRNIIWASVVAVIGWLVYLIVCGCFK